MQYLHNSLLPAWSFLRILVSSLVILCLLLTVCACCFCSGLAGQDLTPMSLGLSHSLSRYKLKFSPDKVNMLNIC